MFDIKLNSGAGCCLHEITPNRLPSHSWVRGLLVVVEFECAAMQRGPQSSAALAQVASAHTRIPCRNARAWAAATI
jgi:hypothetical protein